jgi:hypothetical protein
MDSGKPVSHTFRHLLVRSVPDGFMFGKITSKGVFPLKLKLYAAIDFPDALEKFLIENHWLDRTDMKVTLIDFTNQFMVLPNDFTDDESVVAFFRFQNGEEEDKQIYTALLDDEKQTFCWEIPEKRDKEFERLFPNLTLLSSSFVLTNWIMNQSVDSEAPLLTAHFYGHHMQLFIAEAQRLLFANTFVVKNEEEICYFLLRSLEQLGIDPHKLNTYLCSETIPNAELIALLSPYLANITAAEFTVLPDQPFRMSDMNPENE